MMTIKHTLGLAVFASIMTGCASSPDDMHAAYVSPMKYNKYDCDQIAMEMDYVGAETTKLYASLDKKASNDNTQMAVGAILFWPALFFLEGGDGPEAVQYSQMKGEYKALRTASVEKKCAIDRPATLDELVDKKIKKEKEEFKSTAE